MYMYNDMNKGGMRCVCGWMMMLRIVGMLKACRGLFSLNDVYMWKMSFVAEAKFDINSVKERCIVWI